MRLSESARAHAPYKNHTLALLYRGHVCTVAYAYVHSYINSASSLHIGVTRALKLTFALAITLNLAQISGLANARALWRMCTCTAYSAGVWRRSTAPPTTDVIRSGSGSGSAPPVPRCRWRTKAINISCELALRTSVAANICHEKDQLKRAHQL